MHRNIIIALLALATLAACGGQPTPPPDVDACPPGDRYIALGVGAIGGGKTSTWAHVEARGAMVLTSLHEIDAMVVCAPASARSSLAAAGARLQRDGRSGIPPHEEPSVRPRAMGVVSQWHLSRIGAPAAWARSRGRGVVVHVIDTGADGTHPALAGRIVGGATYVGGLPCGAGLDCDDDGHGTHVSATIAEVLDSGQPPDVAGGTGVAPEVGIFIRRVLENGSGWDSDIARAVLDVGNAARAGTPTVANLSLGSYNPGEVVRDAVAYATQNGARIVAARGNGGGRAPMFPGCFEPVLSVLATNTNDTRASFSDFGACGDIGAPGVDIVSAVPGGGYAAMSGTSMASPQVAGAMALLMAIGDADPIGTLLRTMARVTDATLPGRLDVAAAVLAVRPGPTATAGPTSPGYVVTDEPTRNPYPGPGTPTWTATPTVPTWTPAPTRTPSRTGTPTATRTPTATGAPTTPAPALATMTPTRTATVGPTATRTATPAPVPTLCTRDVEVWTRGRPNGWTVVRVLCPATATRRP